ncbi:N-6 DNA methylase [Bradyrhizobium sp. DOA9]|uniref:N-6 DNA methylase n=1 Tax=Bradyrhizobium sp. DOA9 TaxID=1126627 RepID=UPI001FCD1778|nr:N-6 DNA methylase [Bradyrhizobium sp. DOA9]
MTVMAIASPLGKVLEATGYLEQGRPAPGVRIADENRFERRSGQFAPDALWRGPSSLTVYFKYLTSPPGDDELSSWRREIWNEGFAPLLWIISPTTIELYNGFGRPLAQGDAEANRLHTFKIIDSELAALDELAGRLAMESGQFWLRNDSINRKNTVDQRLLSELSALERDLVADDLERGIAQGLIGRAIFTQYLVDRGIVDKRKLKRHCGEDTLPDALRNTASSRALFAWLRATFNGDMFPASMPMSRLRHKHFVRVADFLEAIDPGTGQHSLFPYRFDIIPVELISSIYEQFAHSHNAAHAAPDTSARKLGVHYTRLPVASLVLDEVMNGATGNETVVDLTCGSGVFLVEAFRRLVAIRSKGKPDRRLIRSVLYDQVFGVDISEAAIRVATFSLYLAALELDPDPHPAEALKFRPLIGSTLFIGNARDIETTPEGAALLLNGERRRFDLVVGNPPWTFKGKRGTAQRAKVAGAKSGQPRGEGFDFVLRALDFAHDTTRFGIILSAMPFFAASKTGAAAALDIVRRLSPATIVNLAPLIRWLFPTAKMPAVALLARCRKQPSDQLTVVNIPWSPSGEKSQTFEISPSDISTLSLAEWEKRPRRLKAAAFGCFRDIALLSSLQSDCTTLGAWLESIGSSWRDGLILGTPSNRTRSASAMRGLPFLENYEMENFKIPDSLSAFREPKAQWPRDKATFSGPLLIVKEFLNQSPRPITAVSDKDVVFTDAYFGAPVARKYEEAARVLSVILSSSFAAWFFLMTASEFGVWKRRLLTRDVGLLPIPALSTLLASKTGSKILSVEKRLRASTISDADWSELDALVADAYHLDAADRTVVQDGLLRAEWQWDEGRQFASASATTKADLAPYAESFLEVINSWLGVSGKRSMKAEIYDLPALSPLRVVRFVLQEPAQNPTISMIQPHGRLSDVLKSIGSRMDVPIASSLIGQRELRVHSKQEVVIIKPAARRYWMKISALEDADAVVVESFKGAAA